MTKLPTNARIYVAGHAGLVGSAVVRRLRAGRFTNILTGRGERSHRSVARRVMPCGSAPSVLRGR
jgi:nucleoside-diphosphate-sugar epimerase